MILRTLVVSISIHHGNTEKIAKVMAEILNAKIVKPSEVDADDIFMIRFNRFWFWNILR